jgi:hypothetical protein
MVVSGCKHAGFARVPWGRRALFFKTKEELKNGEKESGGIGRTGKIKGEAHAERGESRGRIDDRENTGGFRRMRQLDESYSATKAGTGAESLRMSEWNGTREGHEYAMLRRRGLHMHGKTADRVRMPGGDIPRRGHCMLQWRGL